MRNVRTLWLAAALVFLAACGGGDDWDDGPPPDPNAPTFTGQGWVDIEFPGSSSYTSDASFIGLSGSAFISPDRFVCCSGSATDTAVTVTWSSSTGTGGTASQSVNVCNFFGFGLFLCDHTWSADVPLAVGTNVIRVHATDGGRNSGTDTITVTRPG